MLNILIHVMVWKRFNQAYVNHTVVKETTQMNALLQKKRAEKN